MARIKIRIPRIRIEDVKYFCTGILASIGLLLTLILGIEIGRYTELRKNDTIFTQALRLIDEHFIDPTKVDIQLMNKRAVERMLGMLHDPYSKYMDMVPESPPVEELLEWKVASISEINGLDSMKKEPSQNGSYVFIRIKRFRISDSDKIVNEMVGDIIRGRKRPLIIDVRDNLGGWLDSSVYITSLFLKKGSLVVTTGAPKRSSTRRSYFTKGKYAGIFADWPIVVLVNKSTASAAEIFAGALQDNEILIVGNKTYGKGIVQTLFHLSNGAIVKFTTEEWYTPNGKNIIGKGILPDVVIDKSIEKKDAIDYAVAIASTMITLHE